MAHTDLKTFRKLLGADSILDLFKDATYEEALQRSAERLKQINRPDHNALLVKAAIELVNRRWLPTIVEPSYYNSSLNFGCGMIGFFMPADQIHRLTPDEDVKVYVTDAATECIMREQEMDIGGNINGTLRKPVAVTVDKTGIIPYIVLAVLMFPRGGIEYALPETKKMLENEYVWVQVRPTDFGGSIVPIVTWLQGL